jgi:hypothetical protein
MRKERIILGLLMVGFLNGCISQPEACSGINMTAFWDKPGSIIDENVIKSDGSNYTVLVVIITNTTRNKICLESLYVEPEDEGQKITIDVIKDGGYEIGPEGEITWQFKIYSDNEAPGKYDIYTYVNGEKGCMNPEEIRIKE